MALFPIFAEERDALGIFKPHSADYSNSSEGGLVVELGPEAAELKISNYQGGGSAADRGKYALLDEQATSTKETSLGSFLPANQDPVFLGPATHLASGRISVWLQSGHFLTDKYEIATDAYGEAGALSSNDPMFVTNATVGSVLAGTLTDVDDGTTDPCRIRFLQMVDDESDLLATRVTPIPLTGLFAEKAPILIYQD